MHFPPLNLFQTPSNSGNFPMGASHQRDIAGSYSSANPRPNTLPESPIFPSSPSHPICSVLSQTLPRQNSFSFDDSTQHSASATEKEASQSYHNVEFTSANSEFKFSADPSLLKQTEGLTKHLSGGAVRKKGATPCLNLCPRYFEKIEAKLKSLAENKGIFNALVTIFSEHSVAENHSSQPGGSRNNKVKTLAKIHHIDRTSFAKVVSTEIFVRPPETSTEEDKLRLELSVCPDGDKCVHVHPQLCHYGIAGGGRIDRKSSSQQSVFMDPRIIFLKTHKRADNGFVVEKYPMLDSYEEIEGSNQQLTFDISNPNENIVSLRNVPSSKILINRGSVEHSRLIRRLAAASKGAAVPPMPPAPLCAHFSKNGMCCMGNACGFIHLDGHRLEPDANQRQKQTPKEKKSPPPNGNASTSLNFNNSVNLTSATFQDHDLSRQHLGMPIQHQLHPYQPMQVPVQHTTMIHNTPTTLQPFFTGGPPVQHGPVMPAFHQPNLLVRAHDGLHIHPDPSLNPHLCFGSQPSQMYQPQPQQQLITHPHQHIAMGPTLQPIHIAPATYTSYSVPTQLLPPHLPMNQAYGPTMMPFAYNNPSVPSSSSGLLPQPPYQYGVK